MCWDWKIDSRLNDANTQKNLLLVSSIVVIISQLPVRISNTSVIVLLKINNPVAVPVVIIDVISPLQATDLRRASTNTHGSHKPQIHTIVFQTRV